MTSPFDPARRTLLTAIAGLTALAVLPGDWRTRLESMRPLNPLDALLRRIRATPGAAAIAAAWRAAQPAPANPAELRARLALDIGPEGGHLRTAIARDFAAGRMLLVDGWPVAESEARLCALAEVEPA